MKGNAVHNHNPRVTIPGHASRSAPRQRPADLAADLAPVVPITGQSNTPPGEPVPGGSGYRYTPGVGVWRDQRQVLPWCPVVDRHLVAYTPRGEIGRHEYTITVGGVTATVPGSALATGAAWERFPATPGRHGREIRDALANIVEHQAAGLPETPLQARWEGGRLMLPPADVLPRGYGQTAGTPEHFAAMLRACTEAPRVALAVGFAAAALYVEPLAAQSSVVHFNGAGRQGKTTASYASAAVLGYPAASTESIGGGVILPWSTTAQGPGTWLRQLSILPGWRDELNAGDTTPAKLQTLVMAITQGAERDGSTRTMEYREAGGGWHGYLFSTGNEGIASRITNEGVAARVIELTTPITPTAEVAHRIEAAAVAGYGHGLAAIAERGPAPDRFRELATEAAGRLGVAEGGVGRTIGRTLAMAAAGGAMLADLFGVPEFAAAVDAGAREALAEQLAALAERGGSPGDRLIAAVGGAMNSDPGRFPTRTGWESTARQALDYGRALPSIWGYDTTDDPGVPGDVAVIQTKMREIADSADIADVGVALRALRRDGRLIPGGDELARPVWVVPPTGKGKRPVKAYVLARVHTGTEAAEAAEVASLTGPGGTPNGSLTGALTGSDLASNGSNGFPAAEKYAREGGPCEQCRRPGLSCGIADTTEPAAPCVCCGGQVYGITRCGARREHVCHGPEAAPAAPRVADSTPAAPNGRQRAAQPASGAGLTEPDAAELADWQRAVAKLPGEPVPAELAAAALAEWHAATGGLRWVGWEGDTATSALAWLDGKRGAVARGEAAAGVELAELAEVQAANVIHLDYVNPGQVPALGEHVTALDINGQYLSAAGINLGTGKPRHLPALADVRVVAKVPGYVRLAADLDYDHPAFAGRLTAGRVLAMPYVKFLTDRGVEVPVAEAWVWPSGEHRPHLGAWQRLFRDARNTLMRRAGTVPAARVALRMVKATYTVFLGGWLRSEKNNGRTWRRDWADHIVAEAWVRAMVAIERAEAAGGRVLGMRRDSAWFLADSAPVEPAGLTVSDQLGKWKVDRWAAVTPAIIDAHAAAVAGAAEGISGAGVDTLNLAIKSAHEAREAGQ